MVERLREERLMILNMVKEGRISVEEANKLLEAIRPPMSGYHHAERKAKKIGESVDCFVKDFNTKVETAYKDAEPMFKKATKTVVEKTVNVVDSIAASLNETLQNMEEPPADEQDDEPISNGPAPEEKDNDEPKDY